MSETTSTSGSPEDSALDAQPAPDAVTPTDASSLPSSPPTAFESHTATALLDPPPPAPSTAVPNAPQVTGAALTTTPQIPPLRATTGTVKRRNVAAVWLGLPVITLGFYLWFWWPTVNTELTEVDPRIKVNGFGVWAAMVPGSILIVPPFVSVYNTGKRIAAAQHAAGIGSSCSPVVGILLMFVFSLTPLYYQSELNKIADAHR